MPTMGALHEGHLLAGAAQPSGERSDAGQHLRQPDAVRRPADLARYPRTLESDLAMLRREGTDFVLLPDRRGPLSGWLPVSRHRDRALDGARGCRTARALRRRADRRAQAPADRRGRTRVLRREGLAAAGRSCAAWPTRSSFRPTSSPARRSASPTGWRSARGTGACRQPTARGRRAVLPSPVHGADRRTRPSRELRRDGFVVDYVEDREGPPPWSGAPGRRAAHRQRARSETGR